MYERTSLGKQFESEDDINTASLHHLCKDKYRAADGKNAWTVLVITLSRKHMYKYSVILVVLLSCILLLQ